MKRLLVGALTGAAMIVGMLFGVLAIPSTATAGVADTVCCYRWWGVSAQTTMNNVVKTSPKVNEIDWARVWLDGEAFSYGTVIRIASNTTPAGGYEAVGGGVSWVYIDPPGTVMGAPYGRCYWTDYLWAGHSLAMACEMKYR